MQCTRSDSLDVFFKDILFSPIPKIAVIGCGCSIATEEISHASMEYHSGIYSYIIVTIQQHAE